MGFERDGCSFILQKYDNKEFAGNLMLSVRLSDIKEFRKAVMEKNLPEKFGIRVGQITYQPYGLEVAITDIAGVCWHFIE